MSRQSINYESLLNFLSVSVCVKKNLDMAEKIVEYQCKSAYTKPVLCFSAMKLLNLTY